MRNYTVKNFEKVHIEHCHTFLTTHLNSIRLLLKNEDQTLFNPK